MKPSWFILMLLPSFIGLLNFQNPHTVTVHFLIWKITMSTALMIGLTALLGALAGIALGGWSRRDSAPVHSLDSADSDSPFGHDELPRST